MEPGSAAIVGVISDTHGLLRPEATAALAGASVIVHAGDIGDPSVLDALGAITPVIAVRGNNDRGAWARSLPDRIVTDVAGMRVCVVHDVKALDIDAEDAEREAIDVIIAGHSHRPSIERRGRLLLLNPGSAGPRRFSLPVTVARLRSSAAGANAEVVALDVPAPQPRSAADPARRRARRRAESRPGS